MAQVQRRQARLFRSWVDTSQQVSPLFFGGCVSSFVFAGRVIIIAGVAGAGEMGTSFTTEESSAGDMFSVHDACQPPHCHFLSTPTAAVSAKVGPCRMTAKCRPNQNILLRRNRKC